MRSQTFAKSLPMPMVEGAIKRLELLRTKPELRERLWTIVRALQAGLKADGLNIGRTNSPVTPVYLSGSVAEGTQVAMDLRENYNLFCSIVVYPVIPKGQLLLRLIPVSYTHLYQGQKCSAASRAYIPANIWPEVENYVQEDMASIKVGGVEMCIRDRMVVRNLKVLNYIIILTRKRGT